MTTLTKKAAIPNGMNLKWRNAKIYAVYQSSPAIDPFDTAKTEIGPVVEV